MTVLQSAKTVLFVFETIAEHQPIGVSELARLLKLTKATAQRCLLTLRDAGWIRAHNSHITKWVITAKSFSLGRYALDSAHLRDAMLPTMLKLRDATRESVYLMVEDGRDSIGIERIEGTLPVRFFIPVGERVALHAAASGKTFLAHYSPEALAMYLAGGLNKVTERTIINPEELRRSLQLIRKRGWAMSIDEFAEETSAVAAPILDTNGCAVVSIVVALPTSRFPKRLHAEFAALVVQAGNEARKRVFGSY